MALAATVIFYHYGIGAKSHSSAINLFGEQVVRRGIVDKEVGKSLIKAFDMRQKSHYGIDVELSEGMIKDFIT